MDLFAASLTPLTSITADAVSVLSKHKILTASVLVSVAILITYFFMTKESYRNSGNISLLEDQKESFEIYKDATADRRSMWQMSDVTTNQSYDVRGEDMDTPKEDVVWQGSGLDDNLLNSRVKK